MNTSISTLNSPLYAAKDSKGRFIVMTSYSLDIYRIFNFKIENIILIIIIYLRVIVN